MVPLIQVTDLSRPLDHVKVGIMDDRRINAANARPTSCHIRI
jgi:hypothetical protein